MTASYGSAPVSTMGFMKVVESVALLNGNKIWLMATVARAATIKGLTMLIVHTCTGNTEGDSGARRKTLVGLRE